jgi:hypothetical protein
VKDRESGLIPEVDKEEEVKDQLTSRRSNINILDRVEDELKKEDEKRKNELVRALEDMYNELTIEHAV